VFDPIRKVLGADTAPSDAQLLDAFARGGEETAFTLLVQRHGRLVWGVCRRVLRDPHDAEDAFQATFLVLARKASSIRKQSSLGSWLYGVAFRLSCQLRKRLVRQRRHEQTGPNPDELDTDRPDPHPEPAQELSLREALTILDEEVGRLPEKFRAPVVLCYLQGKTNEEAARDLRCPAGTLKSRLLRARELLSARLTQRGAALSAGSLTVLLATAADAAVPPTRAAVASAMAFVSGGVAPEGAVRLACEMIRTMTMNKIRRIAFGLLVLLGLLGSGAAALMYQAAPAAPPAEPDKGPAPAEQPKPRADANGDALPPGALARLGTLRWRHGSRVNTVGFAAGGKEVVTAGPDGVVRVWDAANGQELRRAGATPDAGVAEGFFQRPTSFSADGSRAATTGENGTLIVWDLGTGKEVRRFKVEPKTDLFAATLTPDGKGLLISALGEKVVLWDVATGKELQRFEAKTPTGDRPLIGLGGPPRFGVGGLVFSPDGKLLAAPFLEGQEIGVRFWDVATGKETRRISETMRGSNEFPPNVPHPAFSPDGRTIARVAIDGTIRLHATADGKELRSLGTAEEKAVVAGFVFAPDGKALATLRGDRSVRVYDTTTGKEQRTLGEGPARPAVVGPIPPVFDAPQYSPDAAPLAFSPDGRALAIASGTNVVRLWDTTTGKPLPSPAGHTGAVMQLGIPADGKTAVTLGADGTLRQWETTTGKELRRFKGANEGTVMSLSATGRLLARLVDNRTIALQDVAAEKDVVRIEMSPAADGGLVADPNQFFYFSENEKILAARELSGAVRLWDTASGKALRVLPGPQEEKDAGGEYPFGMAPTRDGRTILTIGLVADGAGLAPPGDPPPAPAGQKSRLRLWDTATGTMLRRWDVSGAVSAAAFTPDGRSLAAVTEEGVGLWETATGQLRYHRKGPGLLVACSPDGRTLAVSAGAAIRLIDLRTDRELGRFKGHQADVQALAFTRNGKALVSGSTDSTALVWDVAALAPAAPKIEEPGAKRLDEMWKELAGDAGKAFVAASELSASPKAAVALLAERVKPVTEPDAKSVAGRIADFDSDSFDVRQAAATELGRLGELVRPALDEALKKGPSAEARRQIEGLLGRLKLGGPLSAEDLRLLRAVEVLEWVGTPEARKLLAGLAKGAAGARLTRTAAESLQRMEEQGRRANQL
jgi:RNA polymerase sigma factor (sigma-70 family)